MENYALPGKTKPVIAIGLKEVGPYYWVGNCRNGIDYYAGQTFKSPADGKLKSIKLFPCIVYGDTDASLTIYEFDQASHQWKDKKGEVHAQVSKSMEGKWVTFELPEVKVKNGAQYAFKISCNHGGMLAIAECPWNVFNPYADGEEWIGSSISQEGHFHKDFDLAFEAEIEA